MIDKLEEKGSLTSRDDGIIEIETNEFGEDDLLSIDVLGNIYLNNYKRGRVQLSSSLEKKEYNGFSFTVIDGTIQNVDYDYNHLIKAYDRKDFAYWMNQDGEVVSYFPETYVTSMYGDKEIIAVYGYEDKNFASNYLCEGAVSIASDAYYDSNKIYCEIYYNFSNYLLGIDNVYTEENTQETYITEKFVPSEVRLYISSDEDILFDIYDEDFENLENNLSYACLKIDAEDMYNLSVKSTNFNTLKHNRFYQYMNHLYKDYDKYIESVKSINGFTDEELLENLENGYVSNVDERSLYSVIDNQELSKIGISSYANAILSLDDIKEYLELNKKNPKLYYIAIVYGTEYSEYNDYILEYDISFCENTVKMLNISNIEDVNDNSFESKIGYWNGYKDGKEFGQMDCYRDNPYDLYDQYEIDGYDGEYYPCYKVSYKTIYASQEYNQSYERGYLEGYEAGKIEIKNEIKDNAYFIIPEEFADGVTIDEITYNQEYYDELKSEYQKVYLETFSKLLEEAKAGYADGYADGTIAKNNEIEECTDNYKENQSEAYEDGYSEGYYWGNLFEDDDNYDEEDDE